ncbi:RNA exonuclease 4 isoform X2 [Mustela erminea]|uniref:RNA exonuclease 4 isoform X2 n=1 Tax=Mustela erminea TaxID=36723 RepID=UPI001387401E|nr:RNA exonuclease 4 isoform X2 [Mustela erminea]
MAKALTRRRAPGDPLAEPGPGHKPPRRRSRKRSLRRSKGREAGRTPGGGPGDVVARPPKAPEDFSRNWRALREDLRGTGRCRHLPHRPAEQSTARQEPAKGQTAAFLQEEETSSIRSGKLRRRRQPAPVRERLEVIQQEVADLLKGRILVGHALHNDLKVLFLDHPKKTTRDTQKYKPFRSHVKSGRPSLKLLAEKLLGIRVQEAEHCSIQDAQTAMRLYILVKKEWERTAQDRRPAAPTPDGGRVSVRKRS